MKEIEQKGRCTEDGRESARQVRPSESRDAESAERSPGAEMNQCPPAGQGEGSISGFCSRACYCCFRQHERFAEMKREAGWRGEGCCDGDAGVAVTDWEELRSSSRLTEIQQAEGGRV